MFVKEPSPKVAILIPTMNRSEFLIRQLRYYASVKSPHPVYIGDASNEEHRQRIENEINNIGLKLTIHYHHWPDANDRQSIAGLAEVALEPYCAYTGDDDFLIPDSLTKCAEFLKTQPDYRTAQGKAILFSLKESGPYGVLSGIGTYWTKKEAEENTGVRRISQFAQSYWVPQFSVHRTREFVKDSVQYQKITDKSFGELLHSFTFISKGKSKFIDCLYLFRQGHEARYILPDIFDWLTGSEWHPSFGIFKESLTSALIETDGISIAVAQEEVKQTFWAYLSGLIEKKYKAKYFSKNSSFRDSIRKRVKMVPGAVHLVRNFRAQLNNSELSLPALLTSASPYHKDFMPVYEAITKQPITQ
jgi:glycosyltransferase domain-containing protein